MDGFRARVIEEFTASGDTREDTDVRHYGQNKHAQKRFLRDMEYLISTIYDMGNPICENSSDLLVFDTIYVGDKTVADGIQTIENIGHKQYDAYVRERLIDEVRPISDPIKRNNIPLFTTTPRRVKFISQRQVSSLKNDCSLFSRLYLASQIRNGDLDDFFLTRKSSISPSSVQDGFYESRCYVRSGRLLGRSCSCPFIWQQAASMFKPGLATKTFLDFADQHFFTNIKNHTYNMLKE